MEIWLSERSGTTRIDDSTRPESCCTVQSGGANRTRCISTGFNIDHAWLRAALVRCLMKLDGSAKLARNSNSPGGVRPGDEYSSLYTRHRSCFTPAPVVHIRGTRVPGCVVARAPRTPAMGFLVRRIGHATTLATFGRQARQCRLATGRYCRRDEIDADRETNGMCDFISTRNTEGGIARRKFS